MQKASFIQFRKSQETMNLNFNMLLKMVSPKTICVYEELKINDSFGKIKAGSASSLNSMVESSGLF